MLDLLLNCSECRKKLLAIERFVNEKEDKLSPYEYASSNMSTSAFMTRSSTLSFSPFVHILLRPISLVLRRFLEEMEASTQRHMIHNRGFFNIKIYF